LAAAGAEVAEVSEPAPDSAPDAVTAAEAVTAPAPEAVTAHSGAEAESRRLFASPLVRRLAREHGIDLAAVAGSGPNGRIVRRDIDVLITAAHDGEAGSAASAGATSAAPTSAATASARDAGAPHTDIPHTGMRRAIARRLVESTTTIPHFTLTADCRVDEVIELRARFGERTELKPSVNDFVLKAVAAAMVDVPEANAIWTEEATRRFHSVDLAVAVSVPDGLVTPVVRGV